MAVCESPNKGVAKVLETKRHNTRFSSSAR